MIKLTPSNIQNIRADILNVYKKTEGMSLNVRNHVRILALKILLHLDKEIELHRIKNKNDNY